MHPIPEHPPVAVVGRSVLAAHTPAARGTLVEDTRVVPINWPTYKIKRQIALELTERRRSNTLKTEN